MSQTKLQSKKAKKILIIEDEGELCLLLNIMLKGKQIDLDHVNTLANAKAYMEKGEISLIILDNKLPDGLGLDFIDYVKKHSPETKIVMISGFGASVKDLALHNGADLFLEKPFTREQVSQSVQELLN